MIVFGPVTLVAADIDRYGRHRNLNREIVLAGLAWCYRQYAAVTPNLNGSTPKAKAAKGSCLAAKQPLAGKHLIQHHAEGPLRDKAGPICRA
jgi:hypothetical protein